MREGPSLPCAATRSQAGYSRTRMTAEMGGPGQSTGAAPLFLSRLLIPAVRHALAAEVRLQSTLAATQTIEALRMHAAANGGQLPKSLDDVTIVPVPLNPATDKPFRYDFTDGLATPPLPAPAGRPEADGTTSAIRLEACQNISSTCPRIRPGKLV